MPAPDVETAAAGQRRRQATELVGDEPAPASDVRLVGRPRAQTLIHVITLGHLVGCRDMSILAIDAGTTGVTALVVTPEGTIAAKGYQEFRQHFPQPGWVEHSPEEIWQATLEATRDCLEAWDGSPGDLERHRHHQPARDGAALGPRDAGLAAPRDRVAGPAYGRHLPADARGGPRGAGHRADRPAAGPLLLRHQAGLAGRERAEHLGAGRGGSLRDRHRRLLPDRPDDPRHLARHRRLQRLPHAALRPRGGRRGPRSCATCSACRWTRCPRSCPTGASSPRTDPKSFLDLELPDRRHRRRPAVGAVRPDLLRRRRLQVHLRHRLVHPHQHRDRGGALRRRPALHGGLAVPGRRARPTPSRARSS